MQSERGDILEERYAIKLSFKLGKNATEIYEMLRTAFEASIINRASIFEWHKRFKEGRESVGADERCGRSKEVRIPELIGQIKNFMDKDSCVSVETISAQFDVSVETVHTIIREKLKMKMICAKCVPRVLREDQRQRHCHDSRLSWSFQLPQFLMLRWPVMKAGSSAMTQRPRDRVPSGSMLALPDQRRLDRANPPSNFWWSLFWHLWHDLHALGCHWTESQQGILCWVFNGVQEENPSEEASTFQFGSVAFPPRQCSSTQLHPWPKWASRQFLSLHIVQTLLPVTFGYSLSSRKSLESVVMRQLRRWKSLCQWSLTRSHKRNSMGPSRICWNGTTRAMQPEEITSKGTRVPHVYYQ